MSAPATALRGVSVTAPDGTLLDDVDLRIAPGTLHCLLGHSGSGKSTVAAALIGELAGHLRRSGDITVAQRTLAPGHRVPAGTIAVVPQNPPEALNPARRLGAVLREIAALPGGGGRERIDEVLDAVGLPGLGVLGRRYPHQVSGGQQQRLLVAHALLSPATILVADEPTASQDSLSRDAVGRLLRSAAARGMSVLVLTHDLDLARSCDEMTVLVAGRVVESGPAAQVLDRPRAEGTRALLTGWTRQDLAASAPAAGPAVLSARGLTAAFRGQRGAPVLQEVTLEVPDGGRVGIIGPSGSGKSTLLRCLAGLHRRATGELRIAGQPVTWRFDQRDRAQRHLVGFVHQDTRGAFLSRVPVLPQVARPAERLLGLDRATAEERALELLLRLGLTGAQANRSPRTLSGGELQRCAIARAALTAPAVLACDEVTSALDGPTRAAVLEALRTVTASGTGTSLVIVTHDLSVCAALCDHVVCLDHGRVAEAGATRDVLAHPVHPVTQALVAAYRPQESS